MLHLPNRDKNKQIHIKIVYEIDEKNIDIFFHFIMSYSCYM